MTLICGMTYTLLAYKPGNVNDPEILRSNEDKTPLHSGNEGFPSNPIVIINGVPCQFCPVNTGVPFAFMDRPDGDPVTCMARVTAL